MRKFMVCMVVSMVFLSIGFALCLFELSDYEFVEYNEIAETTVLDTTVSEHNKLRLDIDDDIRIAFEYDEDAKDKVSIEFSSLLNYKKNDSRIKIKDLSWSWSSWKKYYTIFIDGLRDHKLTAFHHHYTNDDVELVTVTCSKAAEKWIEIHN